jgi:hypothetical protein
MKMRKLMLAVLLLTGVAGAQLSKPALYIEPQDGFETYMAAAIAKKKVPVDLVTDKDKAAYLLKPSRFETKKKSTGEKVARCLFLYCVDTGDEGSVSVQLIEVSTGKILWAYSAEEDNSKQTTAEIIAKHLKNFIVKGKS